MQLTFIKDAQLENLIETRQLSSWLPQKKQTHTNSVVWYRLLQEFWDNGKQVRFRIRIEEGEKKDSSEKKGKSQGKRLESELPVELLTLRVLHLLTIFFSRLGIFCKNQ